MYLNKTVNADVEGLLEIMRKIDYILQQMALSMIQSRDMLMMKFLSQIALTLFLFGSLGWIMGKVEPLAKIELNEGNRLLRIAERMSGHELENLESEVVRHSKLPISLAVIDEGLKVNFVTENAEQEFGVSVAQHIGDSRLDLEVLNRIRRYSEKVNLEMSQCQFPEQQFTILLSPHYLLQNGQMRLARIVITKLSEQSQLLVNLSTAYNSLFYRAFPSLVKADVALPQLIPSSQKGTYLIILTLCGFHDWSLRAVPQVLMRFRREISDLLLQKCGTKEMFLKVIEHPETIVLMVNRDLPSSLFWCLLETCFNFSLELLSDVEAIAEKYGAEVQGRVMVFRCKDPDWYISDRKMALFDCCSDVVLLGLAMESKGQLGSVNYASQRKEMRVKNTTKLCDCFAADGTPFELSLVV
jgi:hypothetical protein